MILTKDWIKLGKKIGKLDRSMENFQTETKRDKKIYQKLNSLSKLQESTGGLTYVQSNPKRRGEMHGVGKKL